MDVGALRKVLKRYGHWRRLQDHVTMLSEAEGAPIGRALTNEEQKRLLETAASNPEWEHVYCAAVLAANTSMRGVEVKHVRRKDVDLEKVWDVESAAGIRHARSPDSGYEQLCPCHVRRVFVAECLEHHPFLCTDPKCKENSKRH